MSDKLSALMDGELDRDSAAAVIKSLGANSTQREDWDCYHLIGDALRGDDVVERESSGTCTARIFSRLAAEPIVFAPNAISQSRPVNHRARIALAMAASVMTVSAIGIIALKQQSTTASSVQLVQQIAPQPVTGSQPAGQVDPRVNDYLAVHRQFANPAGLQAAALRSAEPRQAAGQ